MHGFEKTEIDERLSESAEAVTSLATLAWRLVELSDLPRTAGLAYRRRILELLGKARRTNDGRSDNPAVERTESADAG
jgi:hypothetical protein